MWPLGVHYALCNEYASNNFLRIIIPVTRMTLIMTLTSVIMSGCCWEGHQGSPKRDLHNILLWPHTELAAVLMMTTFLSLRGQKMSLSKITHRGPTTTEIALIAIALIHQMWYCTHIMTKLSALFSANGVTRAMMLTSAIIRGRGRAAVTQRVTRPILQWWCCKD